MNENGTEKIEKSNFVGAYLSLGGTLRRDPEAFKREIAPTYLNLMRYRED